MAKLLRRTVIYLFLPLLIYSLDLTLLPSPAHAAPGKVTINPNPAKNNEYITTTYVMEEADFNIYCTSGCNITFKVEAVTPAGNILVVETKDRPLNGPNIPLTFRFGPLLIPGEYLLTIKGGNAPLDFELARPIQIIREVDVPGRGYLCQADGTCRLCNPRGVPYPPPTPPFPPGYQPPNPKCVYLTEGQCLLDCSGAGAGGVIPQNCFDKTSPYPYTHAKQCACETGEVIEDLDGNTFEPPLGIHDPPKQGTWTAFGCIPNKPQDFAAILLRLIISLGGGIAFLVLLRGAILILTSQGDPEKVNQGKEWMTSAIFGLLFMVFGTIILAIIGIDIFRIPGFLR